jgi:hypothetical protein
MGSISAFRKGPPPFFPSPEKGPPVARVRLLFFISRAVGLFDEDKAARLVKPPRRRIARQHRLFPSRLVIDKGRDDVFLS